jgi:20S proteasome subunit alpha 3
MASERRITSGLLAPSKTSEKTYPIAKHIACNVAGMTADANILIERARIHAGRYYSVYQDNIPVEQLVEHVCNRKQQYTQIGGLRPYGVAFLFAGYDEHYGFQLYQSDPSGNYSGWKATVIGANNQAGKSILKSDYRKVISTTTTPKPDNETTMNDSDDPASTATEAIPTVQEALKLAVKVLNKTMDGTGAAAAEKMELFTLMLSDRNECIHHILTKKEAQAVIDAVEAEAATAGDA